MKFFKCISAVAVLASTFSSVVNAGDNGVIGPTYEIAETSALDMIMNKLQHLDKTGQLKKYKQEAINRSLNSIKNMAPVDGLTIVDKKSSRLLDPTVKYDKAIVADDGRIIVPAGASVNPLVITGLSKRLVFFDGRDKTQSEAVRKMVHASPNKVKPILTAGSWLDLSKAWKTQVYFDQQGTLARRFQLRAVPTVISQQGAMLLVEEIPGKELK